MSVNRYRPHVFVLPEDDANKELANGFLLRLDSIQQIKVLRVARGWSKVLEQFESQHVTEMDNCRERFMILLIDFDGRQDRLETARAAIPGRLADRVFVLGALSKPEALKPELGKYEDIGSAMADDCRDETNVTWGHKLLQHNAEELERLREHVRPFLFPVPQK